ncbi:HlyD family type I secretion periplasmic adaptor subunit [Gemmobacter nectariphilus]|uniref:HlyD family type I secretion periplasmic adaptor subunit n=1 Tax=Gemmobacter nectariphilus TaxID=220343 RepID=UPI0003FB0BF6|nr:HlyD family type I secretion periplasmic adaptor subunit [Gemmobacter nectariphilus]
MTDAAHTPGYTTARLPTLVGFGAMAIMIAGLGIWATQAQIDGAVVASGRVIVDRNRQAVQHPDGGVVKAVLVKEGDSITRGDVLVQLDPTLPQSELSIIESQLYELMSRRGRLEAERDGATDIVFDPALVEAAARDERIATLMRGQKSLFEARLESFRQGLTQLENQQLQLEQQVEGIDAQRASLQRQIELTEEEKTGQETLLERGLAQGTRVLNLRREVARLAGSIGEMQARRGQAMENISEIKIEMLRMHSQRREEAITTLRDLQISEMELAERRYALTTRLNRMEIRAPLTGVVYDVRLLGEQSVIRPADPLLFIIPQDRPMVIESRVSPININSVHIGQEVVIRFRAFDMRETPDLLGRVTRISPDAFTDPTNGASFYRVEVELPEAELAKLHEGQVVIPGMPVDTFLRTGEYSPLTYLTQPLTRYFKDAMREGH